MTSKKKEPAEPKTICNYCAKEVKPVGGALLLSGKAATFRHVKAPLDCSKGDPLFEDQAHEA